VGCPPNRYPSAPGVKPGPASSCAWPYKNNQRELWKGSGCPTRPLPMPPEYGRRSGPGERVVLHGETPGAKLGFCCCACALPPKEGNSLESFTSARRADGD
jgi:hypothetical protein